MLRHPSTDLYRPFKNEFEYSPFPASRVISGNSEPLSAAATVKTRSKSDGACPYNAPANPSGARLFILTRRSRNQIGPKIEKLEPPAKCLQRSVAIGRGAWREKNPAKNCKDFTG